ncbi:MAG TPA: phosphoribosylanthranilate isomerase [Victivallales bacterium]|nr:phosphoribosylanthranilate isomerase [Victivallales bacterium]
MFCLENGANAIGFVGYSKSPRFISPESLTKIINECKNNFRTARFVAVLVSPDISLIKDYILAGANTLQIHSHESINFSYISLIKENFPDIKLWISFNAHSQKPHNLNGIEALHYDSFDPRAIGGTGRLSDWQEAKKIKEEFNLPLILAGGLNHQNISNAIQFVSPDGVDASSGLEISKGKKDKEKIKIFISSAITAFKKYSENQCSNL